MLAIINPCPADTPTCTDTDGDDFPGALTFPLEADKLSSNVRKNNNVVRKNVTVAGDPSGSGATGSTGTGGTPDGADAFLRFEEANVPARPGSVFEWGDVFVDLGGTLYSRWAQGGSHGVNVQPAGGTEIRILASGAVVDDVPMQPSERFTVQVRFAPDTGSANLPLRAQPDIYTIDMEQYAKRLVGDELVGGAQFQLKTFCPLPSQGPD